MHAITRGALLIVLVLCACSVHAAELYPVCNGEEHMTQAAAKSASTVVTLRGQGDTIDLHCLVYEITSIRRSWSRKNTDYCLTTEKDLYTYNLVLRSTSNKGSVVDYNIADIIGGSITNFTVRVGVPCTFSVILRNPSTDSRCTLKARLRMSYTLHNTTEPRDLTPSIDSMSPLLLSTERVRFTTFALHYETDNAARSAANDTVTLVNVTQPCDSASSGLVMRSVSKVPSTINTTTNPSILAAFEAVIYPAGVFRVCHTFNSAKTSTEIGVVTVYATNPGFYEIISSNTADNRVHVGDPFTIVFHGSGLDSRAGGDRAMLVDADSHCLTGQPAGGVPMSTHLLPGTAYGERITQTMWNLTIRRAGSYKVCYARADTRTWQEVPYADDIPAPPAPKPSDSSDTTPVPTDPADKKECPMAPENTPEAPWVNYHGIELVLTARKIASDFLSKLSEAFCIPRAALYLVRLNHTAQGNQVVYFTIDCESVRIDNKVACSTQERYNYIVYLDKVKSDVLTSIGAVSATGLTSMIALDDDPIVIVRRYSMIGLVAVSIILLAAAALAVVAVRRYRENRAYFVQFGVDENEINDMYEVSDVSQTAHAIPTASPAAEKAKPVKGAVIEVEE